MTNEKQLTDAQLQRIFKDRMRQLKPGDLIVIAEQPLFHSPYVYALETVVRVDQRYVYTEDERYMIEHNGNCSTNNRRWISFNQKTGELRTVEWYNEWKVQADKREFVATLRNVKWDTLNDTQLNAIRAIIEST